MKKYLFFALMLGMAVCNFSCSDDDDEKSDNGGGGNTSSMGNQKQGLYADKVSEFIIDSENAPKITKNDKVIKITGLSLTEYGKGLVELKVDEELEYETYDLEIDDNTCKLSKDGKPVGTIEMATKDAKTRKSESTVELIFNLNIEVEINGKMVPVTFNSVAQAQQVIDYVTSSYTNQITNTWAIERMKLTIDFDEKGKADVSTEVKSGNLRPFIELADKNNVTLNEQDRKELTRTIKSLIIDKSKVFVLEYEEGGSDAANWRWVTEKEDNLSIGINLKDNKTMGNKFFNDDSKITVQLRKGNKINLILQTRLEDDKCNASLIVNLK